MTEYDKTRDNIRYSRKYDTDYSSRDFRCGRECTWGKSVPSQKTAVAKALKQGYAWEDVWGIAGKTVWWEQSELGKSGRR